MTDSSRYWTSALDKKAKDYRDTKFEVIKTAHAFIPITGVAPILGYLVLIILGVSKINQGQLSIGEFVALQSYVFIIQGPLFELGNIVSEWQRGFTSLGRVLWVLRQEEENHLRASVNAEFKRENLSSLNSPHLKISNLNFGFEGDKQPILKEINLDLIPGDRLAVRGAIGSGKSTFLKICSGLERGYTGSLFLNGRPLKEIPHSELTQTIAYVPQKSFLFAATVRENIELDQSFSDKEIWHFLELAAIDSDIRALPNGLNTRLGEWGINLSGGQKQRLTIARALARKASIFVFDDCMSAIDTVTEDLILSRLNNLFKNEILIWAAHRDSTLRYCNKTLQLGKAYDA